MKTAVLISIVAFAVACDGSRHAGNGTAAKPTGGGGHVADAASPASSSTVTLVGCLQASSPPAAPGVAETDAGNRASTPAAAQPGRFVLANASVVDSSAGANNAGAAVVSGGSSFELNGVPSDARANLDKRVRVTGRLDAPGTTTGLTSRTPATPDASGAATTAASTTGETSTRDDVRANSTGVAGDSTNHRLTVESVQVVAQHCGP